MSNQRSRFTIVIALAMLAAAPIHACADDVINPDAAPRWWKGNLHTHTFWSDGNDFPEMVADWYRAHGYNFLALSDHNTLNQGQKWVKLADVHRKGTAAAMEKYLARFGPDWVEQRGGANDPASREVRLKPLSEYRALVETRGQFIMIQGEEISDRYEEKPIHLNATNLIEVIKAQNGKSVSDTIANNIRAVEEQAERTGTEILPHLNHPNFQWAVTAEELADVINERFFEVYNGHPGVNQLGDEQRVSVDRMWDIANTIRMLKLDAAPLYGLGTDDSHHYHDEGIKRCMPGRGWVMVRARHLTPESLIRAMKAGDFYASSGVTLADVKYSKESRKLQISIRPDDDATYATQFIGTPKDADLSSEPVIVKNAKGEEREATRKYSGEIGKVLATVEGSTPSYTLKGDELYVRAIVTSSRPHPRPSFENQREQAWTQPVGWTKPE